MVAVSKYVGIPWVCSSVRPPSFAGCDCYGLVRLLYAEEFGISIPDPSATAGDAGTVHEDFLRQVNRWERLLKPEPWCAVAMRRNPRFPDLVTHFGIYVSGVVPGVLHSPEEVTGSLLVRLSSVARTVEGFYAWRG
jgi:murein DD-endopeptidase